MYFHPYHQDLLDQLFKSTLKIADVLENLNNDIKSMNKSFTEQISDLQKQIGAADFLQFSRELLWKK